MFVLFGNVFIREPYSFQNTDLIILIFLFLFQFIIYIFLVFIQKKFKSKPGILIVQIIKTILKINSSLSFIYLFIFYNFFPLPVANSSIEMILKTIDKILFNLILK